MARTRLPPHEVADLGLAPAGDGADRLGRRADAGAGRGSAERFAAERPLDGIRLGACLHVTAETANLVQALTRRRRPGRAVLGQPAVGPGRRRGGARVRARHRGAGAPRRGPRHLRHATSRALLEPDGPQITIDDGADLLMTAHALWR